MRPTLCVLLLTMLVLGCGGPRYQFGVPDNAPDWVKSQPTSKEFYAGVGISAPGLTLATARRQAEVRARFQLGRIIESRIQQLTDDHTSTMSEGSAAMGQILASESNPYSTAGQEISKTTISGSYVEEFWTNPQDGTTYALVFLSKKDVLDPTIERVLAAGRESRAYGQALLEKARADLESRIAAEYGTAIPAGNASE